MKSAGFSRPSGTLTLNPSVPGSELPGYFHNVPSGRGHEILRMSRSAFLESPLWKNANDVFKVYIVQQENQAKKEE